MKAVTILAASLIAAAAAAFWVAGALPVRSGPARHVTTERTVLENLTTIRAVGYVEPASEVRKLTFEVDGIIDDCRVTIGQAVKAGDELAILRNNDQQAEVVVAEKQLTVAQVFGPEHIAC